ncbi:NmrA family NAD(P)-binding protein [Geodermatophilus sp. YIM 151500]|uniref:SDR family oxidoreductase n=1 Tax=Geodermatophilus sp. YIM 151500 TaxID=2984531 RepID=UPI0021E49193|nr:NmrA family NAD(P)-binding protein [Geodermatophilus sp. YIM 151500]MCV2491229.1 NmrA family NAD(P)-binding protein [Geodermatophilus sp. YIM 151500]
MILVTAAGGTTGLAVTGALTARGVPVRALVGSDRARAALEAHGAQVVRGDLEGDLGAALDGVESVYAIWPNFDEGEVAGAPRLFRAARAAGVRRVVYHSVLRPGLRVMPHHAGKAAAEEQLDAVGVAWRVLQPCAYADNLDAAVREAVETGQLRSAWGLSRPQSFVDVRDVAECAAVLLTEEGLDSGTFEVAGPEPLTAADLAERVTAVSGRDVVAVDAPASPDRGTYAGRCLATMFDWYRDHGFAGSPRVATALLGRPPRSYTDHLADVLGTVGGAAEGVPPASS